MKIYRVFELMKWNSEIRVSSGFNNICTAKTTMSKKNLCRAVYTIYQRSMSTGSVLTDTAKHRRCYLKFAVCLNLGMLLGQQNWTANAQSSLTDTNCYQSIVRRTWQFPIYKLQIFFQKSNQPLTFYCNHIINHKFILICVNSLYMLTIIFAYQNL